MALENDAMSHCPDGQTHGTPGRKTRYTLDVHDGKVTVHQRIDSPTAPLEVRYDGDYTTFRDQIQIDSLNARWTFDGTALRLIHVSGGSCTDTVLWTTNPWILRPGGVPDTSAIPDGTYDTALEPGDRRLCDGRPEEEGLNPPSGPGGNATWFESFTFEHGSVRVFARVGGLAATPQMWWVGRYRASGNTFELTELTSVDHYPTKHRSDMTATFTFDGTTLTLKPVATWACDAKVVFTRHPLVLKK
jgi:hypothetical protein